MNKIVKLSLASAVMASSVLATNGSILIGTGVKARSMGGMVVAKHHGAENGLYNASLLTKTKQDEFAFCGTIFEPNVSTDTGQGAGFKSSATDQAVIPEISIANKITDEFYMGIGMWGTAGMGVDYRDNASNFKMVSALQLMQFGVPLAYKIGDFSIGATPFVQYGSLDINYDGTALGGGNTGGGVSDHLAFGYNLSASYDVDALTLGFVYTSQVDMRYDETISTAMTGFGQNYSNNTLSTPAGYGLGASYEMGSSTIAVEYRNIMWSDAKGYQDFGWKDQDVYILGYEYSEDKYDLRLGYNYAKSPVEYLPYTGTTAGISNSILNVMNLLGFPATVEEHYTLGGTYRITDRVSLDFAYTYAPEVTDSYQASLGGPAFNVTSKHSQTSMSFGVNYLF